MFQGWTKYRKLGCLWIVRTCVAPSAPLRLPVAFHQCLWNAGFQGKQVSGSRVIEAQNRVSVVLRLFFPFVRFIRRCVVYACVPSTSVSTSTPLLYTGQSKRFVRVYALVPASRKKYYITRHHSPLLFSNYETFYIFSSFHDVAHPGGGQY